MKMKIRKKFKNHRERYDSYISRKSVKMKHGKAWRL